MLHSKLLKEIKDYVAGGASSTTEEDSMSATGKYRKMSNVYFTNIQQNYFPPFMFLKSGTADIQLLSVLLQVDSSKSSYSSKAISCLHPISASHFSCSYHTGTLSCHKSHHSSRNGFPHRPTVGQASVTLLEQLKSAGLNPCLRSLPRHTTAAFALLHIQLQLLLSTTALLLQASDYKPEG